MPALGVGAACRWLLVGLELRAAAELGAAPLPHDSAVDHYMSPHDCIISLSFASAPETPYTFFAQ